ncbi:hypothetical protein QJS04_geneDACA024175 [Acorus gramineus]|uniref:Uncharacterized protein n=1 Tax=Acorus gramineus TaxID=55184 RepID=A0AAV8ZX94_ACOGR|nr:hypothetical protein QJS04_geneDACA024175 [Acorus gramineus]
MNTHEEGKNVKQISSVNERTLGVVILKHTIASLMKRSGSKLVQISVVSNSTDMVTKK